MVRRRLTPAPLNAAPTADVARADDARTARLGWARVAAWTLAAVVLVLCPPGSASAGGIDEFELKLPTRAGHAPQHAAATADGRLLRVRPTRRFNLVGFRWRGAAPRIQVQSYGVRGWSRWATVPTDGDDLPDVDGLLHEGDSRSVSGPVWTGRAYALRVRVEGDGTRALTAHFLNVPAAAARPGYTAGARAAAAGGVIPTVAGADTGGVTPGAPRAPADDREANTGHTGRGAEVPAPPAMVTRAQWGADRHCKPRARPAYGEVLTTVVHHTVSTNTYSRAEAASVVLGICRYHRNSNRWNDIGYNILIDRFGTIYEGRGGGVDRPVIGAHAQGYNGQTAGIALVGTFTSASPPQAMIDSLREVLKWKLAVAGITRNERVAVISTGGSLNRFKNGRTVFARPVGGHREFDATSCPGDQAFNLLPALAGLLDQAPPRKASRLSLRMKRTLAADGGHSVVVSGRLRAAGAPVVGAGVEIQAYDSSSGWLKIAEATTDASGFWQAQVRPPRRQSIRAFYAGDSTRRPGRSPWLPSPKLRPPPAAARR